MLRILCLIILFISSQLDALHDPKGYYSFETQRKDWAYSTTFEMDSHAKTYGTVEKQSFHVRSHYDLYDELGNYKGQGIARFFCLGIFWTWGTEIDIYDDKGKHIGFIDGELFTSGSAKYEIFDIKGKHVANAYLDEEGKSFSIVPSNNEHLTIADINRVPTDEPPASWKTEVHIPFDLDIRIIMIFSAFIVDKQDAFYKP